MAPPIDASRLRLDRDQYYSTVKPKRLVVLHHTVGGSARSTWHWWMSDPRHIATAYLVERDGTIYECFPPQYWAWHLGIKDKATEMRSIGIELCSEGGLTQQGGSIFAFKTQRELGDREALLSTGRIVEFLPAWRGFHFMDAYETAQIEAVSTLVPYLCDRFHIPHELPDDVALEAPADLRRWIGYSGVIHHAMLRSDKSDLHPGFPWHRLREALT